MIVRFLKEILEICNFILIIRVVVVCDRNEVRLLSDFKRVEFVVIF